MKQIFLCFGNQSTKYKIFKKRIIALDRLVVVTEEEDEVEEEDDLSSAMPLLEEVNEEEAPNSTMPLSEEVDVDEPNSTMSLLEEVDEDEPNSATPLFEPELDIIPIKIPQHQTRINEEEFLSVSHDYGETWNPPFTPPPFRVKIVALYLGENIQVCLGKFDFIYHSADNGDTWIKASNQPQLQEWVSFSEISDDTRIEAVTQEGVVYISLDLGNNW